jgi:hypothetical protein
MYPTIVPGLMALIVDDRMREARDAAGVSRAARLDARDPGTPRMARARLAVARALIALGERVARGEAVEAPRNPCGDAAHAA